MATRILKSSKAILALAIAAAAVTSVSQIQAATVVNWTGGSSTVWTNAANWNGGSGPAPTSSLYTNIASFDLATYPNNPNLAASASINGIVIGDGTTPATLTLSGSVLSVGSGGILLSANAGAADLNSAANGISIAQSQTWTNASGSTLTMGTLVHSAGANTGTGTTLNVNVTGAGTVTTKSLNAATGILGAWATFGTGTNTKYAFNTTSLAGGAIGGFTGTSTNDITTLNNANTNYDYDLSSGGVTTLTGSAIANTLRYTGTGGAQTINTGANTLTLNGLLNASTGKLTIAGTGGIVLGSTVDRVTYFDAAAGDIDVAAPITVNSASASGISVTGPHNVGFNSITNNGTGTLFLNGNAPGQKFVIGSSGQLVLNAASGLITTLAGNDGSAGGLNQIIIADNPTFGPSSVRIQGSGNGGGLGSGVILTGNNTFSGGLIVDPGAILVVGENGGSTGYLGTGTVTFNGGAIRSFNGSNNPSTNNKIVLSGDFAIGTSITDSAFAFGAGPVSLTQNVTMNVLATGTSQIQAPDDSGNGFSFTKAGVGTVTLGNSTGSHSLSPVNVFTGKFSVSGGTVKMGSVYALNRNNIVAVDTGATLNLNDASFAIAGLVDMNPGSTGSVVDTTSGGGATLTLAGQGNYAFGGNMTGSFTVIKDGSGTQTLSGLNSFTTANQTPGLIIGSGTINLDFSGAIATAPAQISGQHLATAGIDILFHVTDPENAAKPLNASTNMAGGTLQLTGLSGAANVQHLGSIGTSAGANKIKLIAADPSNSVLLSTGNIGRFATTVIVGGGNASAATLDFTLPAGTQSATNGIVSTASNTNGIMGGSFTVAGTDWAVSNATHVAPAATIGDPGSYWDDGDNTIRIFGSAVTGSAVSFNTINGTGSNLVAGRLYYVVGSNGSSFKVTATPGGTSPVAITGVSGTTTLSIDTQGNIAPFTAYSTGLIGNGDVATDNFLLTGSLIAPTQLGSSDTVNSLKIANTSTGSLDFSNTHGGLFVISSGGILFTGSADYAIDGDPTYRLNNGNGDIYVQQYGTGNLTFNVKIRNSILTKSGPGTLILNSPNTDSPTININEGTLAFATLNALGNGTSSAGLTINFNGGTLQYGTAFTGPSDLTVSGSSNLATPVRGLYFNAGGAVIDTNGFNVNFANTNNAMGSQIGGGHAGGVGGLTKVGAGTLTLNGEGQYQGPTIIKGGVLSIGGGVFVAEKTLTGTLGSSQITGLSSTVGLAIGQAVTGDGIQPGVFITSVGATSVTTNNGVAFGSGTQSVTFGSFRPLNDGGPKNSSSIGISTYAAENLILDGGTLQYTGPAASTNRLFTVTQNSGAIDASSTTNDALTFSNPNALAFTGTGARTLTLTGNSTGANTLNSRVADAPAAASATTLTKDGAGTWIVTNANTYTGNTIVQNGVLLVNNSTGSGTGTGVVIMNGGTLGGHGSIAGVITPSAALHTIAPSATLSGTSTSTLTALGLSTNSSTTLAFNLVSPGASSVNDKLNITGNGSLTLTGGHLAITHTTTGVPSLGYYKAIAYNGTLGGTLGSITMPTVVNNVAYVLDSAHDAGFIDIHRGFLGDANDDGTVNFDDFLILSQNFGQAGGWSKANFISDPTVDFNDFLVLSQHFGQSIGLSDSVATPAELAQFQAASASFFAGTGVPEPTSLALLGIGAAALLTRRRRQA